MLLRRRWRRRLCRGIQATVKAAEFYGPMLDEGRVLRSYKEDISAFVIHPGLGSKISESQHLLQCYLNHYSRASDNAAEPLLKNGNNEH